MAATRILAPKIPAKITDFIVLIQAIQARWLATPLFTLFGLTLVNFQGKVSLFINAFNLRVSVGLNRPELTQAMKNLDDKVLEGLPEVKSYIATQFGTKNAHSHYSQFGIVHDNEHWLIPVEHSQRLHSIDLMVSALAGSPFGANTYGTAYWTAIQTNYHSIFEAANASDGTVSADAAQQNVLRGEVEDMVKNVYYGIAGNYWQTFEGEVRNWGFQYEDY